MKENCLNGVVLGYLVLKIGGEEVEGGSSGVDSKQLEEREDIFTVSLAVERRHLNNIRYS